MKELDQILDIWEEAGQAGDSAILATIVKINGSSYRRCGARMIITSRGRKAGSISGGCLEGDILKKGWWLTEGGRSAIRKYDSTSDEDAAFEFGLGCNGIVHVLLERLETKDVSPLSLLRLCRELRQPGVIATVISSEESTISLGQRLLLYPDGSPHTDISERWLVEAVETDAKACREEEKSKHLLYEAANGAIEIFFEVIQPPVRLLVFGAGDDAQPVVQLAKAMGWSVTVLDGRSHYARAERFPAADQVMVLRLDDVLEHLGLDEQTVAVVMTHSYSQDGAILKALLPAPLPYLGVLGPRRRTDLLVQEKGFDPNELGSNFHSPVGLDIGADAPEEVALAILSEIQAALNARAGGMLRNQPGPIHQRDEANGETEERPIRSAACLL